MLTKIDILEGVHNQGTNHLTLHTSDGCSIDGDGFSGSLTTSNCYVNAEGQSNNQGCSISASDSNTYGAGFNANNGGVYATEITSDYISIWFFPRGSIPSDIEGDNPSPSSWGQPLAHFEGSCDIPSKFYDMELTFDTTFCGDWAGGVWSESCAASTGVDSCTDYVANNGGAFTEAYWTVNALKVYQLSGGSMMFHRPF